MKKYKHHPDGSAVVECVACTANMIIIDDEEEDPSQDVAATVAPA